MLLRSLLKGRPVATMLDYRTFQNILSFGMCSHPANPIVASATAATMGVLTPMSCIPVTVSP